MAHQTNNERESMYPRFALPKNWNTANPAAAQIPGTSQRSGDWAGLFATGLLTVRKHHPGSRPLSKPKMKLLVLAQIPPPLHGQSAMVRTLVAGLPAEGVELQHVNLRLSRDAADIGRWRPGKLLAVLDGCASALGVRLRHGCDTLYYIPAPAKRGALYRDWLVMLLCRPFFRRLVLHWHAAGLGEWLRTRATAPERWLSQFLLGGADLAIVLSPVLQPDASALAPRAVAVVPNGIPDPGGARARSPSSDGTPFQVLFLSLCSRDKGLFAAAEAVVAANQASPRSTPRFTLVAAGSFPDSTTAHQFDELCRAHPAALRYAGHVTGAAKTALLQNSHCLCLPTTHPAEAQPLVLLEAMACDLPIIATRWRAIAATVPPDAVLVEPGDTAALTEALLRLRATPPPVGVFRKHFLAHYTEEAHLTALANAMNR